MKSNLSKAEMLELSNTPDFLVQWTDGAKVFCTDDNNTYILSKSGTATEETGLFVKVTNMLEMATMPGASAAYKDMLVKYTGATSGNYVSGSIYRCVDKWNCPHTSLSSNISVSDVTLAQFLQRVLPTNWEEARSVHFHHEGSGIYTVTIYTLTGTTLKTMTDVSRGALQAFGFSVTNPSAGTDVNIIITEVSKDGYRWDTVDYANKEVTNVLYPTVSNASLVGKLLIYNGSTTQSNMRAAEIFPGTIFKATSTNDFDFNYQAVTLAPYLRYTLGSSTEAAATVTWYKITEDATIKNYESKVFSISLGRNTMGFLTVCNRTSTTGGGGIIHLLHQGTSGSTDDFCRITAFKYNYSSRVYVLKCEGGGYFNIAQINGFWNKFTVTSSATEPTDLTYTAGDIMLVSSTKQT